MEDKMDTFSARLASFDAVLPSIKSRTSASRNFQPMTWPYDSPSPEELAHAGFFFNPYDTNPDNTTCFLCRRALDGWEEGDNPITEHLKHSPDCGWAILMDIQQRTSNPAEIEDPTSVAIVEARRATFAIGWPHDAKAGWVCQSDKMVEAGWYFCPSEESPDLASCPYCRLSLDGWEETDNPFEEHHRRSSDCSFFVFALPATKTAKKASRSKKSRVSKASRLSTQSVMTTASEAPTIEDDAMDTSIMSQTTAKKTKGTKKSTRSRTKKAKKEEPLEVDGSVEPEQVEEKAPEHEKPKRAIRGTKRGSEAVTQDLPSVTSAELDRVSDVEEPSPKRQATKIRRSVSQQLEDMQPEYPEESPVNVATAPVMPKKGRKGAKKSTATKARKTSTASSSGRTTRGKVPDDSVLEAAIEADLDRDMQEPEPFEFHYKDEKRESARFRQSIAAEDNEEIRAKPQTGDQKFDPVPETEAVPEVTPELEAEAEPKAKKSSKRKAGTKKSKKEKGPAQTEHEPDPAPEAEPEVVEHIHSEPDLPAQLESSEAQTHSLEEQELLQEKKEAGRSSARHGSIVAVEDDTDKPRPESESENVQPPPKKPGRKAGSKNKKRAASNQIEDGPAMNDEQNDAVEIDSQTALPDAAKTRGNSSKRKEQEENDDVMLVDQRNSISEAPAHKEVVEQPQAKPKRGRPAKNPDQAAQNEKQMVEAKPKRGRPSKQTSQHVSRAEPEIDEQPKLARTSKSKLPAKNTKRYSDLPKDRHRAQSFIEFIQEESSSPIHAQEPTDPRTQEKTPSPSPQSSDAENRPPSTRPRSARPPIVSPSKTLTTRVPLAASTPTKSPWKRQADTGYLSSTTSWGPMDIDELLGNLNDKENRDFTINQGNLKELLTSPEKKMTVEEWIKFNAKNGEERLKQECERLISIFEREGGKAMRALEGIECID